MTVRRRRSIVRTSVTAVVMTLAIANPSKAQVVLKAAVVLLGGNATNDAISLPAAAGTLAQDLYFQVERPLTDKENKVLADPWGELLTVPLQSTTGPGDVVPVTLTVDGSTAGATAGPVRVPLAASSLRRVTLHGTNLRPGTTYKGLLVLRAADQSHRWDITVTTAGRGVLKVIPVGPLQFTALPPFSTMQESFSVTLRNRSDLGAYSNLRAYFESSGAAASKALRSNVSSQVFEYFGDRDARQRLPLENVQSGVTIERDRQVYIRMSRLDPGEYAGALRFVTDQSADDTDDSRLPLVIQVRHHWILPVLVLLAGSLIGWFSAKYLVAARKSREFARQIGDLRVRADDLARRENERDGWSFPSEASSFALIKVRVILSQLARLAAFPTVVMTREEEIVKRRQDAEARLAKLELLRETRRRVQPFGDGRPAAQVAIGRLLRRAVTILEQPTLDDPRVAEFTSVLERIEQFAADATALEQYRSAVARRRAGPSIPDRVAAEAVTSVALRERLLALLDKCPAADSLASASAEELRRHDLLIGELLLLWDERERGWAEDLAAESARGFALEQLFKVADQKFWSFLKDQRFEIRRDTTSESRVRTFNLVETTLVPPDGVSADRIRRHPLKVAWRLLLPDGSARDVESDGITLVQYFNVPGSVAVSTMLQFGGEAIPGTEKPPITLKEPLTVVANPEYRTHQFFHGFSEWAGLLIAVVFATATAMSAQYDSTFGSYSQYLALFVWAAGAAGGGNMFKQLGATSTPGGSVDAALPPKSGQ